MGLDQLASLLGVVGYPEGETWFFLNDATLNWSTKSASSGHPVILRRWSKGPIAVVFPRNTSPKAGATTIPSPAHTHKINNPKCRLNVDAHITVLGLSVAKDELDEASRLCSEEDPTTIAAVKAARW